MRHPVQNKTCLLFLHEVEAEAERCDDEHLVGVDGEVLVLDALHGEVDEHGRHDPDDEDADQRAQDLCRVRKGL